MTVKRLVLGLQVGDVAERVWCLAIPGQGATAHAQR